MLIEVEMHSVWTRPVCCADETNILWSFLDKSNLPECRQFHHCLCHSPSSSSAQWCTPPRRFGGSSSAMSLSWTKFCRLWFWVFQESKIFPIWWKFSRVLPELWIDWTHFPLWQPPWLQQIGQDHILSAKTVSAFVLATSSRGWGKSKSIFCCFDFLCGNVRKSISNTLQLLLDYCQTCIFYQHNTCNE